MSAGRARLQVLAAAFSGLQVSALRSGIAERPARSFFSQRRRCISSCWAALLLSEHSKRRDVIYVERDHSGPGLGMSAVATGNLFALIAVLPFALPLPAASTGEWITIVYLGVCQIGLGYVCLTTGIRHLPVLDVSLSFWPNRSSIQCGHGSCGESRQAHGRSSGAE